MSRHISIFFIFLLGMLPWLEACAGEGDPQPVDPELKKEIVDSITSNYYDWETISMSGKLSSPRLPVTASLKVYMERDSLVLMAVSAPLVGEVARIEIDGERILAVNKMSNTYSSIAMEEIEPICPGGLTALQNLLLGRINILGEGELNRENADSLEIYLGEAGWVVLPNQDLENAPYAYLYTVNETSYQLEKFLVLSETEDLSFDCAYEWTDKYLIVDMQCEGVVNGLSATLRLNYPDEKTKEMKRMNINSKYKEVSPRRLLQ